MGLNLLKTPLFLEDTAKIKVHNSRKGTVVSASTVIESPYDFYRLCNDKQIDKIKKELSYSNKFVTVELKDLLDIKITARAFTHPDDEFNLSKGSLIAKVRLGHTSANVKQKLIDTILFDVLHPQFEFLNDEAQRQYNLKERKYKRLEELLGKELPK